VVRLLAEGGGNVVGEGKRGYVRVMFGRIAGRYDLMNSLMTLGRDRAWREWTVQAAGAAPGKLALDVATGTGELALALARRGCRTLGLDYVEAMLTAAAGKNADLPAAARPAYLAGDALALPFPDGTFDCLTTGFALRNVVSVPAALAEMARVLRPGGKLACLELTPARGRVFPFFFGLYFGRVVPLLGALLAGDRAAYAYLPASLRGFPSAEQLADLLRQAGLRRVTFRRLMFGTVALHVAEK
jgi:demethylmenaquinone methyltransferase / 2-methoxy-6-polyprenyl-1,4-benzoquinol methylase